MSSPFRPIEAKRAAGDVLARACRWWRGEFTALWPTSWVDWALGRSADQFVVAPSEAGVHVQRIIRRRSQDIAVLTWADYSVSRLRELRTRHGAARADLVLRLPADRFFQRSFEAPTAARAFLPHLVVQDLERRTPFRKHDIYHDFSVEPAGAGKLLVRQTVIRRDFVAPELERLGLEPGDIKALLSTKDQIPCPAIALGPRRVGSGRKAGKSCAWLAALAVALLTVTLGSRAWTELDRIDTLEASIATTKAKAVQVRTKVDRLTERRTAQDGLVSRKALDPRLLDVWEEVSRILPDDTWIVELRVSDEGIEAGQADRLVTMTGFSSASAQLVGLLDRSAILSDARLAAPILFDAVEQRERFVLEARLHRASPGTQAQPRMLPATALVSR